MVQVPPAMPVTVTPVTEHVAGVRLVRITGLVAPARDDRQRDGAADPGVAEAVEYGNRLRCRAVLDRDGRARAVSPAGHRAAREQCARPGRTGRHRHHSRGQADDVGRRARGDLGGSPRRSCNPGAHHRPARRRSYRPSSALRPRRSRRRSTSCRCGHSGRRWRCPRSRP